MSFLSTLKSSAIVASVSCVSGLVMLMQEMVISFHFATGDAADAYQLAASFPLLAINVLAGGTLLAVLVPLLTKYTVDGRETDAAVVVKQARQALAVILLTACLVWAFAYPNVISLTASGFSPEARNLSSYLLWVMVPVLFFSGLAGIDAAVLNSRRRFVFVSASPAVIPGTVIASVLLLDGRLGIYAAAVGLLCGSMLQLLIGRRLAAPLLNETRHVEFSAKALYRLARHYATAAGSAAMLSGILLTDTLMASAQPAGSAATFGYASRPVVLLLAFATAVVGNVVLPYFSRMAAEGDWRNLKKLTLFWFGLLALGALPTVALWYSYANEVVELLYQRGAFTSTDTIKVAVVQQTYLLHIPFFLIAVIGWRVMNSLNRNKALLHITAVCFFVNLTGDLLLTPRLGLQGIAWGTNLAFALWAFLIALYLLRLLSRQTAATMPSEVASNSPRPP